MDRKGQGGGSLAIGKWSRGTRVKGERREGEIGRIEIRHVQNPSNPD